MKTFTHESMVRKMRVSKYTLMSNLFLTLSDGVVAIEQIAVHPDGSRASPKQAMSVSRLKWEAFYAETGG